MPEPNIFELSVPITKYIKKDILDRYKSLFINDNYSI